MEGRMTVCNMSIEMGARGGMIAPDEKTFTFLKDKEFSPKNKSWDKALKFWETLYSDKNAVFDKEFTFDGNTIEPMITYGTNPGMGMGISEFIPKNNKQSFKKSLTYMDYKEGDLMLGKKIDYAFLGSCTNGRIEDFEDFAKIVRGNKKAENITAWLVPGSHIVAKTLKENGITRSILVKY